MNAPLTEQKRFTVASANKTLPLVRAIVSDIVELYRGVQERGKLLETMRKVHPRRADRMPDLYSEEVDQAEKTLEEDVERLSGFVSELQKLGVEFKDPVIGLVDFPTVVDGQEAYLCWKLDEPEVHFWHNLDTGFNGRQTLDGVTVTDDSSQLN